MLDVCKVTENPFCEVWEGVRGVTCVCVCVCVCVYSVWEGHAVFCEVWEVLLVLCVTLCSSNYTVNRLTDSESSDFGCLCNLLQLRQLKSTKRF